MERNAVSQLVPWLDRKFDFDFPVSLYPNVLARVRGTPARLEDAVRGLSREQLVARPEGKWSIQENAGHLLDEEDLFWRRLREFQAGSDKLSAAAYKNVELTHNHGEINAILRDFRTARDRQVDAIIVLPPEAFARAAWHPRLQVSMRLVDHLLFIAEHDDYHLARIWELRGRTG